MMTIKRKKKEKNWLEDKGNRQNQPGQGDKGDGEINISEGDKRQK